MHSNWPQRVRYVLSAYAVLCTVLCVTAAYGVSGFLPVTAQAQGLTQGLVYTPHRIYIETPAPDATIRNNTQDSPLTVRVLAAKDQRDSVQIHRWQVILSGTSIFEGPSLPTRIAPVYRGTHTLVVNALDKNGVIVAKSNKVTFYKHQARVN